MNINKIIRSLDLAKSDARDKTIESIIEYILFCINEEVDSLELNTLIKDELLLEIHKSELEEGLVKLVDNSAILKEGGKYKLTTERYIQLRKIETDNNIAQQVRLASFIEHIKKYSNTPLHQKDIDILWNNFTDYIYECYLEHGKNALNIFSGKGSYAESDIDLNIILTKYESKINGNDLKKTFRNYVNNFSKEVSQDGLEYLLDLANKAEAFFALGLSKDEYNHIYEEITFDWTIFVDTNFLYSILDLHSNPDSEAAKSVIELGKQLKIKFNYLNITLQELQNKSRDFETYIPKNLLYSEIQALVKSEQLDDFSLSYFEKKLNDMDNTPHPIDIVGHAINNLKSKGIEIFRFTFEKLSSQEEYLRDKESNYNDYLKQLDEIRAERKMKTKSPKDTKQIYHDVFLREAIIFLRDSSVSSINDVKYFGVTLDKRLIKYDNYLVMRKKDGVNIPTFFSPTILLKKLLKYAPVNSDNYRRAFIKTISTPALDNNNHTSKVTIRSVKYFHNMGISDEKLILQAIKDEIFLSKFKELEPDDELLKKFVESTIQKNFVEISETLTEVSNQLNENKRLLSEIAKENDLKTERAEKLEAANILLQNKIAVYNKTLTNINNINHEFPRYNSQLTIHDQLRLGDASKYLDEITKGNRNLIYNLEDLGRIDKYHSWRKRSLWYLIPIIIIISHVLLVFFWQTEAWNYVSNLMNWFDKLSDGRKEVCKWVVALIMAGFLYKPSSIIWKRHFNEEEKKIFLEKL
jgi:hypothetical protein